MPDASSSVLAESRVERNVIYGMYSGLALLMDIHCPDKPNGYGIVYIPGSGWSAPLGLDANPLKEKKIGALPLVEAGYAVFVVNHRATPRFQYPAAVEDVQRAVRFIRYHAKGYGISPNRIGAVGISSGGYLASMLGVLDGEGDPDDESPINQRSAKVQCVIALSAPSSLMEGGGRSASGSSFLGVKPGPWSSPESIEYKMAKEASPITHVLPTSPPFLLLHGDKDPVVPFDESKMMAEALRKVGVGVKLISVEGGGHDPTFSGAENPPDVGREMVKWLGTHLRRQ